MKHTLIAFAVILFLAACGAPEQRKVEIQTELGNMTLVLYDSTPQHRDNFIKLVNEGFYNGLLFHRVINGFMAQGGDPESRGASPEKPLGMGGPGYTIPAEIGAPHFHGTLAAARTGGPSNPEKRSSGSQFYLVQGNPISDAQLNSTEKSKNIKYSDEQRRKYKQVGGTISLDMEYSVFGEVIEGRDVIDKICMLSTGPNDRPMQDVIMNMKMLN